MVMKINVKTNDLQSHVMIDFFDIYYAYRQAQNRHQNYDADVEIVITDRADPVPSHINIAWYYKPDRFDPDQGFDLTIIDHMNHPFEVCTPTAFDLFRARSECYMLTGSYTTEQHPIHNRTIWTGMTFNILNPYVRPFFPHYFERQLCQTRDQDIVFINGQNRSHRQYLIECIANVCPSIPVINSYPDVEVLKTSFFEFEYDTKFREFVNAKYKHERHLDRYYNQSISVGLAQKFGQVPPGHSIIDEYFKSHCIIFPETAWLNNTIMLTEKIIKCAVTRTIPWPVSGSRTNHLYNILGFQTAWNLLPEHLQSWDDQEDHVVRIDQMMKALEWIRARPDIWLSDTAQDIRNHNYTSVFSIGFENQCAIRFDKLVKAISYRKEGMNAQTHD